MTGTTHRSEPITGTTHGTESIIRRWGMNTSSKVRSGRLCSNISNVPAICLGAGPATPKRGVLSVVLAIFLGWPSSSRSCGRSSGRGRLRPSAGIPKATGTSRGSASRGGSDKACKWLVGHVETRATYVGEAKQYPLSCGDCGETLGQRSRHGMTAATTPASALDVLGSPLISTRLLAG